MDMLIITNTHFYFLPMNMEDHNVNGYILQFKFVFCLIK